LTQVLFEMRKYQFGYYSPRSAMCDRTGFKRKKANQSKSLWKQWRMSHLKVSD